MLNLPRRTRHTVPYFVDSFRARREYAFTGQPDNGMGREDATDRRPQILLIGDEQLLQYSRRMILETAGYAVRSVKSSVAVEGMLLRGIQVVLLCHTVREDVAKRIVNEVARLAPEITVLRIVSLDDPGGDEGKADAVSASPTAFLRTVAAKLTH